MKEKEMKFCKKLIYDNGNGCSVLFGLIISDDGTIIEFQTANKKHFINKSKVFSIADTDRVFNASFRKRG